MERAPQRCEDAASGQPNATGSGGAQSDAFRVRTIMADDAGELRYSAIQEQFARSLAQSLGEVEMRLRQRCDELERNLREERECRNAGFRDLQSELDALHKSTASTFTTQLGPGDSESQAATVQDSDSFTDSCSKLRDSLLKEVNDLKTVAPQMLGQTVLQIKTETADAVRALQTQFDAYVEAQMGEQADMRRRLASLQLSSATAASPRSQQRDDAVGAVIGDGKVAPAKEALHLSRSDIELSAKQRAEQTIVDICGLVCEELQDRCAATTRLADLSSGMDACDEAASGAGHRLAFQQHREDDEENAQAAKVAACFGDAIQLLVETHCAQTYRAREEFGCSSSTAARVDSEAESRLREEFVGLVEELASQTAERHEALESQFIDRMRRLQSSVDTEFPGTPMSHVIAPKSGGSNHSSAFAMGSHGGESGTSVCGGKVHVQELSEWVSLYDETESGDDDESPGSHSCVVARSGECQEAEGVQVGRRFRRLEEWAHSLQSQLQEERDHRCSDLCDIQRKALELRAEVLRKLDEVWQGLKVEHQERCEEYLSLTSSMDSRFERISAHIGAPTPLLTELNSPPGHTIDMQIDSSVRVYTSDVAVEVATQEGPPVVQAVAIPGPAGLVAPVSNASGVPAAVPMPNPAMIATAAAVSAAAAAQQGARACSASPTSQHVAGGGTRGSASRSPSAASMQGGSPQLVKVVPPGDSHIQARSGSPRVVAYSGVAEEGVPRRPAWARYSARRAPASIEQIPRIAAHPLPTASRSEPTSWAPVRQRVSARSTSPVGFVRGNAVALSGGACPVGSAQVGGPLMGGGGGSVTMSTPGTGMSVATTLASPNADGRFRSVGLPLHAGAARSPTRRPEEVQAVPCTAAQAVQVKLPPRYSARKSGMSMQHSASVGALATVPGPASVRQTWPVRLQRG